MASKARPCFVGDGVARFDTNKFSVEAESALQFGRVLRAPRKHGRIFNAKSELTEKDIAWSPNHVTVSLASSNDVFLLERPVLNGSLIKHKERTGEVLRVDTRATVRSLDDQWTISNIPLEDLNELPEISGVLHKGMAVLLNNHLGTIERVTQQVSFRFPEGHSGYFNMVQDENSVQICLEDKIQLTEEQLKISTWDTEAGVPPTDLDFSSPATVFRIQAIAAQVNWKSQVPADELTQQPNNPPFLVEGKSVAELKILKNTPSRLRQYFHSQLGSKLLLTINNRHRVEKLPSWGVNMMSKILLEHSPLVQKMSTLSPAIQSAAGTVLGMGQTLVVKPMFLQSELTVRWTDGQEISSLDSTQVDEVIAGPDATFVTRSNNVIRDASYGIVFNCSPESLASSNTSQEPVNVLWFVDLKNDRLDPAVRVLRLQQEELLPKDLVVLSEMQRLLRPREILTRRDKSDSFLAGQSLCMTQDGRIEVVDFEGNKFSRWPTLLAPCLSNVRTSVSTYDLQIPTTDESVLSGVDWTEIYYDAMAEFEEVDTLMCH